MAEGRGQNSEVENYLIAEVGNFMLIEFNGLIRLIEKIESTKQSYQL